MARIVPDEVRVAAKRGFVRSTAQAYATALAGGVSATTVLAVATGEVPVLATVVTWAVALVSPLAAGAASYLDILSKGIPTDYIPSAPQEQAGSHAA
ncbi:hypothetical protein MUN78_06900 [Leucobacter allii]|uniref:Holin n=1 Tax=Leucobacter allii TaxID=2932247 RepID=A0ABY4FQU0_9MICO|nr:hypothetical protein [Leucobacter allii]UOQ58544.1 hypothetical protein MUN78_06900 [Leucobacter allii]